MHGSVELPAGYKQIQIKAVTAVNVEMLKFYWFLGADIVRLERDQPWGSKFMHRVSADLKELPLWSFVSDYPNVCRIIFSVPWGHHMVIMDKFGSDQRTALFYVRKTVENGWSRAMLENNIASNLHLRQGKTSRPRCRLACPTMCWNASSLPTSSRRCRPSKRLKVS